MCFSICWRNCSVPKRQTYWSRNKYEKSFADTKCKILSKHFGVGLCRNANYVVNIIEKVYELERDSCRNSLKTEKGDETDAHPSDYLSL